MLKKSAESSSTRYPLMDVYVDDSEGIRYRDGFLRCVNDFLLEYGFDEKDSRITNVLSTDFWNRYNGISGSNYSKIWYSSKMIVNIYNHLPQKFALRLSNLIFKISGISLPSQEIRIPDIPYVLIIKNIVSNTAFNHHDDIPMVFLEK